MRQMIAGVMLAAIGQSLIAGPMTTLTYPIVDTGQQRCFDNRGQLLKAPGPNDAFYGQDAFYQGLAAAYRDNNDGTITDLNTGLMWVKARGEQCLWHDAVAGAAKCRVGGYSDWRAPTIKELYSLINFNGGFHLSAADSTPYLDTRYFGFVYGNEARGERGIDCQDWSATAYVGADANSERKVFGVNFADGRIKGYGLMGRDRSGKRMYIRYVRGNLDYGKNSFQDNQDGTISDLATGLMWSKADSATGMNWQDALAWVQARNKENYLGHNDWRLPNAKELQSLVDYTRAPHAADASHRGPAIDPTFQVSRLSDGDYPYFWSSTTHLDGPPDLQGSAAIYIAFGRATGWMSPRGPGGAGDPGGPGGFPPPGGPGMANHARSHDPRPNSAAGVSRDSGGSEPYRLMDVHGAGAQRSDPKSGDPAAFPHGRGPQGDVIRIYNYVRVVRSIDPQTIRLVEPDLTPLPVQSRPMSTGSGQGSPDGGRFPLPRP